LRAWTGPRNSTYRPPLAPGPGAKAGSTPFGVTTTFDGSTPYSRTRSSLVRWETVSTRAARRTALGTTARNVMRSARLMTVGSRSNERSWTVTTAGGLGQGGSAYWN